MVSAERFDRMESQGWVIWAEWSLEFFFLLRSRRCCRALELEVDMNEESLPDAPWPCLKWAGRAFRRVQLAVSRGSTSWPLHCREEVCTVCY